MMIFAGRCGRFEQHTIGKLRRLIACRYDNPRFVCRVYATPSVEPMLEARSPSQLVVRARILGEISSLHVTSTLDPDWATPIGEELKKIARY